MIGAEVLGAVAVALVWPVRVVLIRARCTARAPRAAIVLWQAVGGALTLALLGVCVELVALATPTSGSRRIVTDFTASLVGSRPSRTTSPDELFALTAGLIVATLALGGVVVHAAGLARTRARQRLLIDLVGTKRPELPGAFVLPHHRASAFSIPGLRPRVVVSSGAIDTLDEEELAAVLAHERAHVRARHHLVLLPFRALSTVLPWSRAVARVREEVAALVEMAADDRALRGCDPVVLASALCRMATADASSALLVPTSTATTRRVERALAPQRTGRLLACSMVCSAGAVAALPLVVLFISFRVR